VILFERDKKMASIFLISLMNLKQAKIEKEIHVPFTTQVVLSKLARFNELDRGIDSESSSYDRLFGSFFNKVCLKISNFYINFFFFNPISYFRRILKRLIALQMIYLKQNHSFFKIFNTRFQNTTYGLWFLF